MTKRVGNYSLEDLNLLCEWEDCRIVYTDLEQFITHITQEHLTHIHEDDLNCHWKNCEAFTDGVLELRRHVLLHAFHTKIKNHGSNLQSKRNIPDCTLSEHSRNIVPELPEPLTCSWKDCSIVFESPEHFYRHVDTHALYCEYIDNKDKDKMIACLWDVCNRKFPEKYKLKEHLRSHTQEKLIACPTCGGMFSSRTKFFDHVHRQLPIDQNDPDNVYECEYCSRKTNSERLLRDHMRTHVNHYKCPYCDMTCPTPSGLKMHFSYRHTEEKPYECSYCEYKCRTESDLGKHLESHRATPTYQCTVENCNFSARSSGAFKAHCQKIHEKKELAKYSCHLCEKLCSKGNYLTKHLLNHHKFKWPSGHCRFRYTMHEDGFYRLQTVRYESLELSETILCDTTEDVDDPDSLLHQLQDTSSEENNAFCGNSSFTGESGVPLENENVQSDPVLLYLENGQHINLPETSSIINSQQETILNSNSAYEEEPVLINIVDTTDKSSESGCSVLLIKTTRPVACDQIRSVQLLTNDESGNVVLETAEIISQYDGD